MKHIPFLVVAFLALAQTPSLAQLPPAAASPPPAIALALDNNRVEVTARFSGQRILLFGVVTDGGPEDDVIVVLTGPGEELKMTRKELHGPIWVNATPVNLQGAPSYYALASTRAIESIAPPDNLRRAELGLNFLPLRAVGAEASAAAAQIDAYRRALVRLRTKAGLFRAENEAVTRLDAGLFRASIYLPAGSATGDYTARALLFRNGRVIAQTKDELIVARAGIDRLVYETAHRHSFLYGVVAVLFAVFSGWVAAMVGARH
jgi:uncharacterized protein (TIGR02186 family)